jgi:hypothetical protein
MDNNTNCICFDSTFKKEITTDLIKIGIILVLIFIVLVFAWVIIYFDKRHLYGRRCSNVLKNKETDKESFSGNGSGRIVYCEVCGGGHNYGDTNFQSNHLYHKLAVSSGIPATYDRMQYYYVNVCDDDRVLWPTY